MIDIINSQIDYNNFLIRSLQNRNNILKSNLLKNLPLDDTEQKDIDKRQETDKSVRDSLLESATPHINKEEILDKITEHHKQKNNNIYNMSKETSELESNIPVTIIENQQIPTVIPSKMITKNYLFNLLGITKS